MTAWAALSLRGRFVLLALLPLLASLALIALAVRQQESELAEREHALVRASYMDARRTELKHYVDLAVSTVKPLLGQAGGQQQALQLLSSLDYGPDGYFFVYDLEGRVLMHSRQPELIGQNLWGLRDPQGRPTIQQLIGQAKAGGGYVEYLWRKPSSSQLAPKLGYVVAVPEWQWMLGTGLYLDGIEATMAALEHGARQNITATMLWVGAVAVFGVALISAGALALNLSEHRSAEAKLRALAREVVQSQEDERARLARELHDGVSQALVATKLLIESAQHEPASAERLQALALKRLNSTLAEVRHLSHALRPALLDTLGLPAALQHLAGPSRDSFDPAVLWALVRTVGLYPPGTVLVTSSGTVALSLSPNPNDLRRPTCRVLVHADGRMEPEEGGETWTPMPAHERVARVRRPEDLSIRTGEYLAA